MYENFKRFDKIQFSNHCLSCAKSIEAGQPAYGSNRHGLSRKWIFVCLDCYERDQKTAAPAVEAIEESEETYIDPAVLEAIEEHKKRAASATASSATTTTKSLEDSIREKAASARVNIEEETKSAPKSFLEALRENAPWRLAKSAL